MASTSHLPAASHTAVGFKTPGRALCTAGEPTRSSIPGRGSAALSSMAASTVARVGEPSLGALGGVGGASPRSDEGRDDAVRDYEVWADEARDDGGHASDGACGDEAHEDGGRDDRDHGDENRAHCSREEARGVRKRGAGVREARARGARHWGAGDCGAGAQLRLIVLSHFCCRKLRSWMPLLLCFAIIVSTPEDPEPMGGVSRTCLYTVRPI